MGKVITVALAGLFAVILLVAAAGAGVISALAGGTATGQVCADTLTHPHAQPAELSAAQAANAATIIRVGQHMHVPKRGWVIAIATALQESGLRNLDYGDRDSLGLFQQRPSAGWGTPAQIMTPTYAAQKFYQALLRVPGWQTMPITQAAQAVQHSAYPNAYATQEAHATAIVNAFTDDTDSGCDSSALSAADWSHDVIDIPAPGGTFLRAASAGMVASIGCTVAGHFYAHRRRDLYGLPGRFE
jgi:hypothetical protein